MGSKKQQVLERDDTLTLVDFAKILDEVPLGVYKPIATQYGVIFQKAKNINLPKKIYGNEEEFTDHVLKSWRKSEGKNLGVLLVGKKGLGKSLTASLLANKSALPVIIVDSKMNDMAIINEIKKIKRDVCVLFDEFEKTVKIESQQDEKDQTISQEQLLNALDSGSVLDHRCLFIFTSNSKFGISDFLKNRPGRIRYIKEYDQMSDDVIKEIIKDNLKDNKFLDDLLENIPYATINTDALLEIINEINIHKKPYSKFKEFFNFNEKDYANFEMVIKYKGKEFKGAKLNSNYINNGHFLGFVKDKNEGPNLRTYCNQYIAIVKEEEDYDGYCTDSKGVQKPITFSLKKESTLSNALAF